ncbi:hypothetical protein FQN53_003873 [Emmonsiellopsis sp. PD_33]|nr:hypothetical protein FQN53_003873 [Emmonsiellopsis sp. PD_33]
MHYSALLAALTAALASAAVIKDTTSGAQVIPGTTIDKRDCYDTGERWGSQRNYAYNYASQACLNAFQGQYAPGDRRALCYNLDSTKKVDFSLELISDNPRYIDAEECYDGLMKEIHGCDRGGKTSYSNWKYVYVTGSSTMACPQNDKKIFKLTYYCGYLDLTLIRASVLKPLDFFHRALSSAFSSLYGMGQPILSSTRLGTVLGDGKLGSLKEES